MVSITPRIAHEKLIDVSNEGLIAIYTDPTRTHEDIAWAVKAHCYRAQHSEINLTVQYQHAMAHPALQWKTPPLIEKKIKKKKAPHKPGLRSRQELLKEISSFLTDLPALRPENHLTRLYADGHGGINVGVLQDNCTKPPFAFRFQQPLLYMALETEWPFGWDIENYTQVEICEQIHRLTKMYSENAEIKFLNSFDRGLVKLITLAFVGWYSAEKHRERIVPFGKGA